jgi:hypothetical protein
MLLLLLLLLLLLVWLTWCTDRQFQPNALQTEPLLPVLDGRLVDGGAVLG